MKKKTRRLITLLLAISLTVGMTAGLTAGANSGTMDLDGDGKVTIHDVQLAQEAKEGIRNLTDRQVAAMDDYTLTDIFNRVFGITYKPKQDGGVYQISTMKDLTFLRENASKPSYSYALTTSFDLEGADWEPIDDFAGTFNGNGKTISNFTITTSKTGSANKTVHEMGFFSEILAGGTVKNLNLQNAQIIVPTDDPNVQFAGLLCATNRGTISGCYTHGKITDLREKGKVNHTDGANGASNPIILAALVARNIGGTYSTVTNKIADEPTYNDGIYYTLKSGVNSNPNVNDSRISIAAQLAVEVADRDDIEICLSYDKAPASGVSQFQDISAQWDVSETIQDKQNRVVEYMVSMGQVKWKTPEKYDLVWTKGSGMEVDGDVDQSTWTANTTYYGIPFNGYHNGLERFQSVATKTGDTWVIDAKNSNEVKTGQTTEAAWYTSANWAKGNTDEDGKTVPSTDTGYDGWIRYIGNDCSSACSWAWLQVSPVDAFGDNGAFIDTCRHSFPYKELDNLGPIGNNHYGHAHNLVQVGYYDFFETDDETGEITKTFLTATKAEARDSDGNGVVSAKLDGKYATTSANIWDWNADNTKTEENQKYAKLYETYAQARKGDVMQTWFTGDHATRVFSEDKNGDGVLQIYNEDFNFNGKLDIDEDIDHDRVLDEGEDIDGDGKLDTEEDINGNGELDKGEDLNGNSILDTEEDLNGNGVLDTVETKWNRDINGNGVIDATVLNEDKNNNRKLDDGEDTNGNGVLDTDEDVDGDGWLDTFKEDLNGDGVLQVTEDQNANGDLDTALKDRVWEGHMRMLAEDPVAIRNWNGYFDLTKSYMITCEHGGAVKTRYSSRNAGTTDGTGNGWGLYMKYTFADLGYTAGNGTCKAGNLINDGSNWGTSCCYLPITCKVLRGEAASAQKYSFDNDPSGSYTKATAPYAGEVYTNYALAKATMYIYETQKDGNGNTEDVLIHEETITAIPEGGVRSTQTQYRWAFKRQKRLNLTEQFAHLKDWLDAYNIKTSDPETQKPISKQYKFQMELESVLDVKDANSNWVNSSIMTEMKTFTHTTE